MFVFAARIRPCSRLCVLLSDPGVYDEIMQPVLHSGYLYKSSSVHRGTISRKTREGEGQRGGRLDRTNTVRTGTFLSNQTRLNVSSLCFQTSRSSGVRWTGLYSSMSRTAQVMPACRSVSKKSCVWASLGPIPPTTTTTGSSTGPHFVPSLQSCFMTVLMKLLLPRLHLAGSATPLSCT